MAIRDVFKISWKTFFNPLGWFDYEGMKNQNKTIYSILKDTFSKPQADKPETFEQAKERLGLTDEDVKHTAVRYRIYAFLFFLLGLGIFAYAFFLLFKYKTILGWLLGLAATGYAFSLAFQFDFWSLQMRQRKLGITFEEWKRSILGDKGTSS
jgi:intracellular multiplication protein IcmV